MNRKQRRSDRRLGATPARGAAAAAAPGSAANLFAGAVAQHQAGALAEAERRYRYILAAYPDHAGSLHNLGLLALAAGNASSAVDLIGKAIAIDKRVAEYHYNFALAWRALDRMDHVATHLERAVSLRPDHALAQLNLGNIRREQGRLAEAVACYERAIALTPNSIAANFNLGNVLLQLGRWEAAIAAFRKVLALAPNHADAHQRLGLALMAERNGAEAAEHFAAAVALKPQLPGAHEDLAAAYLAIGKMDLAIHAATRAIELDDTPRARELFVESAKPVRFTAENPRARALLLRALAECWCRPRELTGVCISLIKLNPHVADCIARITAARPEGVDAKSPFAASGVAMLAEDSLLAALLQCNSLSDIGLERLLTTIRRVMLTMAGDGDVPDERSLRFFAAVARQCFINEYVYALPDDEADQARDLQSKLLQALGDGGPVPPLWPIAIAAYYPLHAVAGADALLQRSWSDDVRALLAQQIEQPAEERRLAAAIPALTSIDDSVSQAVRAQYEENPYPRWINAGPPAQPIILKDNLPLSTPDVLIAGCGTGLSTIEFARQVPNACILAIDLSRASLSYAKRMAESFNLDNVEFAQADILRLGSLGRTFDFLDSSGVLHHLADPWAGWEILLSLLRPGGLMQVGLYSEVARRNVVAARALIAERGFEPTPEGIRRCREYIMTTDDPTLKSVAQWEDFFATSECRDLLFHVQEHRTTLPRIKSFMAANGIEFAGFIPEPSMQRRFAARHPDPAALLDLDCWDALESEVPSLFANMYQFWVRKPPAAAATPAGVSG